MKISRLLLIAVLAAASASLALADDTSDPKMGPIGGGGSIILTSPTDPNFNIVYIAGSTNTVSCSAYGDAEGTTCINPKLTDFLNDSGQTWVSVTIDIAASTGGLSFSCFGPNGSAIPDPYFTSCSSSTTNGVTSIVFSGTDATHPGILSGSCTANPNGDGDNDADDEPTCTGPTEVFNDQTITLYDFSILTDVTDATAPGDAFVAEGTASVPETSTLWLTLIGGALLVLLKRP